MGVLSLMVYRPGADIETVPADYVVLRKGDKYVAYGCRPGLRDYVSDDAAEVIQFAIDNVESKKMGHVFISPGTYEITKPIKWSGNIVIESNNPESTVLYAPEYLGNRNNVDTRQGILIPRDWWSVGDRLLVKNLWFKSKRPQPGYYDYTYAVRGGPNHFVASINCVYESVVGVGSARLMLYNRFKNLCPSGFGFNGKNSEPEWKGGLFYAFNMFEENSSLDSCIAINGDVENVVITGNIINTVITEPGYGLGNPGIESTHDGPGQIKKNVIISNNIIISHPERQLGIKASFATYDNVQITGNVLYNTNINLIFNPDISEPMHGLVVANNILYGGRVFLNHSSEVGDVSIIGNTFVDRLTDNDYFISFKAGTQGGKFRAALVANNLFYDSRPTPTEKACIFTETLTNVAVHNNIVYPDTIPLVYPHRDYFDYRNNVGYPTENRGTATVTGDGTTATFTVDVAHGLVKDTAVARVTLDRDGSVDKVYLVDADGDGFKETLRVQVTYASPPAANESVPIYWEAVAV